ncbi:MAG: outer membrane beta-barrel protein [Acidobacteriota bacterium]|nr:outer membrane beta-barrel protein [Acidobacteriota bacterium]
MKVSFSIPVAGVLALLFLLIVLPPACLAQQTDEAAAPEGALLRPVLGNTNWLKIDWDAEFTFSENNHNQSLERSYGSGNLPVVPTDDGVNLNNVEMYVHKDPHGSAMLGYGPLQGAAPKQASWGYYTQAVAGRASGSLFGGWDETWGLNHRSATDPNTTASSLIVPNAYAIAYVPVLGGLNFFGGFYGIGIGHESHTNLRIGPNQFATHTYSLIANPDLALGGVVAGDFFRNQRGTLAWEFGMNSGIETVRSPNGTPAYQAAIRYRTPDFKTRIDYATFWANGEISPDRTAADYPGTAWHGVISPRHQLYQYHALTMGHDFTPRWNAYTEFTMGHQSGDGRAGTIALRTSQGGFRGASWGNAVLGATYRATSKLWYNARYEHYRDAAGYELPSGVRSDFNGLTGGVRYTMGRYLVLRPELRYDWQNASHGAAFNSKRSHTQLTGTIDLSVYF